MMEKKEKRRPAAMRCEGWRGGRRRGKAEEKQRRQRRMDALQTLAVGEEDPFE